MRRWWRTSTGLRRRRCCQRRAERKGGQASGAQGTLGPSGPGNPEGRGWRKGGLWSSQATHPAEGARPRGPGGNLPSTQTRALPRAPFVYAHALPTFAIPGSTVNRYLFDDLKQTGELTELFIVTGFHKILQGHNGGGDPWHTDGNLYAGVIRRSDAPPG